MVSGEMASPGGPRRRHAELDAGALGAVVAALARQASASGEARRCIEYIERNRHRMRRPEFQSCTLDTINATWSYPDVLG